MPVRPSLRSCIRRGEENRHFDFLSMFENEGVTEIENSYIEFFCTRYVTAKRINLIYEHGFEFACKIWIQMCQVACVRIWWEISKSFLTTQKYAISITVFKSGRDSCENCSIVNRRDSRICLVFETWFGVFWAYIQWKYQNIVLC